VPDGALDPQGTPWHARDAADVARELASSPTGLSQLEAADRLRRVGPNALPEAPAPSDLEILGRQFRSPLVVVLAVALVLSLVLGERVDAIVIALALILDAAIGFVQERRAEASVRGLRRLISPRASVMRDGRTVEIDAAALVPGDVVRLESGGRVPADLRLFEAQALSIDESLLTGESVAVEKRVGTLPSDRPLAERENLAYAGTVVARGRARGYVVATGARTEVGAIARSVVEERGPEDPLQQRVSALVRALGLVAAGAAAVVFAIGVISGLSPTQMFRVAVALAVAAVPEGLPVAFTLALAIAVRRMARRRALVRRLSAVETLGSTTVIAADKTGTLTENRMTVREIWAGGRSYDLGEKDPLRLAAVLSEHPALYLTALTGVLVSDAHFRSSQGTVETAGDPTEVALLVAAARLGIEASSARNARPRRARVPFEPERRFAASVHMHAGTPTVFVQGAPESVVPMCASMLGDAGAGVVDAGLVLSAADDMAKRGLRVIAMAYAPRPWADVAHAERPGELTFAGLQGMHDPPREGVQEAIAGCRGAGIRVLMVTGDHVGTARAVAVELGLVSRDAPAILGRELDKMDDDELRRRVREVSVYARVSPEHKLRIVRALHSWGEVVAVTGDGVNDAPALRAADIGVAMGRGGTDVAREAADIVLVDDNFTSIYAAVHEGRVTFDNLRKVTFFLVSTGVGEVLAILGGLALGWPLVLLPAQILWLNLVTEGVQDVALAFEPPEPDVLRRPPRPQGQGILTGSLWTRTMLVGLVMAAGTMALFRYELDRGASLVEAQTVALSALVVYQSFQLANARSERRSIARSNPLRNPFLFVSALAALGVHVAALFVPWTQLLLGVAPIGLDAWFRIVVVATSVIVVVEAHKLWMKRSRAASPR